MHIAAKRNLLGASTTRNLDATVILHHSKYIVQKNECSWKTLSQESCAVSFDINCDLRENVAPIQRLSKLRHTVVTKMPQ